MASPRMLKFLRIALFVAAGATLTATAVAGPLGLGRPADPAEIAAWDIDIRPDGAGLPPGRGTVEHGEEVYSEHCAECHGDFGEGAGRWPPLAGGDGSLDSEDPHKTIGSYWPYLSTVWDYVHRAMPFGNAQSLSDDEVYALTAYLMYLNDLVDDDFELNHDNFAEQALPNEVNFFDDDRAVSPVFRASAACMQDCKDTVAITMRARVLDVTPEETAAATADAETVSTESTASLGSSAAATSIDTALAERGAKVFRKCQACHKVGPGAKHGVGPQLNGVVDRHFGGVQGYKYSKDLLRLADEGRTWDFPTLDAYLIKPKDVIPKGKMAFAGLRKEDDRAAVIEYLKQFAE